MGAKYSIGIDLGTSNCALAYRENVPGASLQLLDIPQFETMDSVVTFSTLPSFLYLCDFEKDSNVGEKTLGNWQDSKIVGRAARAQASQSPDRVIYSAKSWLCHGGVDRRTKILPWNSEEIDPGRRLSPVTASAHYLEFLKYTWDETFSREEPSRRFCNQDIVITVPASFDHVAQQLTLEAANIAGYPDGVKLVEEPQAAFYSWLAKQGGVDTLAKLLPKVESEAQHIFVCDVGGGTTDFSLFEVALHKRKKFPVLRRVAVSDHILLGGDNIDLTLAKVLEGKFKESGHVLSHQHWSQLTAQSRELKERALNGSTDGETFHVSVSGGGSSLLGGTKSTHITREEILQLVFDGFYPNCPRNAIPKREGGGLREFGLPYASDTAVTRYLASFLNERPVDAILFNGGSLKPEPIQEQIIHLIEDWQSARPVVLENSDLDLAVALGAAHYCGVVLGEGVGRIQGGSARSLYLEVKASEKKEVSHLVCILAQGTAAETVVVVDKLELYLLINQAVSFRPFSSTKRPKDHAGQIVKWNAQDFRELSPLQTIAQMSPKLVKGLKESIKVSLQTFINELGILKVSCVANHRQLKEDIRWPLEFSIGELQDETIQQESDNQEVQGRDGNRGVGVSVTEEQMNQLQAVLRSRYSSSLMRSLEKILDRKRGKWPPVLLRKLWEPLAEGIAQRHHSEEHEVAWLVAAGYFLRPGYGVDLDHFRIDQLWFLEELGLAFEKSKQVKEQYYILWRRTAGGLSREQQKKLFDESWPLLRSHVNKAVEAVRMVGAFERLSYADKSKLIDLLIEGVLQKKDRYCDHYLWALGRIMSRVPLYAGDQAIVPEDAVEKVFRACENLDWTASNLAFCKTLFLQAARITENRSIDLSLDLRDRIAEKLQMSAVASEQIKQIREYVPIAEKDIQVLFGESLPPGLVLA